MPSTALRFSTAAWDSVVTFCPSAASVAHDATSLGVPSTDTRQMRQLPTMGSFGYQQSVGTARPIARVASRIVVPSGTVTSRPSIVSVGISFGRWGTSKSDSRCLLYNNGYALSPRRTRKFLSSPLAYSVLRDVGIHDVLPGLRS